MNVFPSLEDDDVTSRSMGASGEDLLFSPAARKLIPFSFECKNQERLGIWDALRQTAANAIVWPGVLVFKRNHSKTYVAMEFGTFLALIKELADHKRREHAEMYRELTREDSQLGLHNAGNTLM